MRVMLDARLRRGRVGPLVIGQLHGAPIAIDALLRRPDALQDVVALVLGDGGSWSELLAHTRALRQAAPHVAIVTVMERTHTTAPPLRRLALAGADEQLVLDHADDGARLVRELERRLRVPPPREAIGIITAQVPAEPARSLVGWCLRSGCKRVRVDDAARHFRVERRTLARWVLQAGLPSVRQLLRLGVLLHADQLRANTDLSWGSVARILGYETPSALQMLRRRNGALLHRPIGVSVAMSQHVTGCPDA